MSKMTSFLLFARQERCHCANGVPIMHHSTHSTTLWQSFFDRTWTYRDRLKNHHFLIHTFPWNKISQFRKMEKWWRSVSPPSALSVLALVALPKTSWRPLFLNPLSSCSSSGLPTSVLSWNVGHLWNTGYLTDISMLERVQRKWTKQTSGLENVLCWKAQLTESILSAGLLASEWPDSILESAQQKVLHSSW